MADRSRKKEKQRLKREKKKLAHRRVQSISPYQRIGQAGDVQACYICSGWEEQGLASIHLVRRNPQGGFAVAAFLVDIWCAGLKDAYGWLDLGSAELDEHLKRASNHVQLERIDLDVARNLIAGSIRFARQNGFRLPAHYDRWVKLLGELPNPNDVDLSRFGKDGKLFWVGPPDDLRSRLIGSTYEEFIARPDVDFLAEVDPDWEVLDSDDEDDQDEFEDEISEQEMDLLIGTNETLFQVTSELYFEAITRILADKGELPQPRLREAVMICTIGERIDLDLEADEVETLDPIGRSIFYAGEATVAGLGLTEADGDALVQALAQLKPYWPQVLDEVDRKVRRDPKPQTAAELQSLMDQ